MHTVLVINQNRDEAIRLREILKKVSYKVYISYRTKEGIVKAKDKKPDLIIDIEDSPTKCFDLIKEMRSSPDFNSTYLIIISDILDDFDKVLALELGADDYLIKPVNYKELLVRMKSMLKYSRKVYSC